MRRPTRIVDFPWVLVRVDCVLCDRRGCYRLARLAARYGPEQSLDGLLAHLAQDCPWWRSNPRRYEPRCGARFVDLDRNLPPPDLPEKPVYRQRQPAREDLPQQHEGLAGITSLATWPDHEVVLTCQRCKRLETFDRDWLLRATPGDAKLPDLLVGLTMNCPRRRSASNYEQCEARLVRVRGGPKR